MLGFLYIVAPVFKTLEFFNSHGPRRLRSPQHKPREVVALRRPGELGVVLNYQKAASNVAGSRGDCWYVELSG